jgi:hypothetical protein
VRGFYVPRHALPRGKLHLFCGKLKLNASSLQLRADTRKNHA